MLILGESMTEYAILINSSSYDWDITNEKLTRYAEKIRDAGVIVSECRFIWKNGEEHRHYVVKTEDCVKIQQAIQEDIIILKAEPDSYPISDMTTLQIYDDWIE